MFSPKNLDVMVVQECENTQVAAEAYLEAGWRYVWEGENIHKGLGIFVPVTACIVKLDWKIQACRYFMPVQIQGGVTVVGVWAMGGKSKAVSYAGQISQFLTRHSHEMEPATTILVGDFNSNTCWDKRHKSANHTENDKRLNSIGLTSVYHHQEASGNGNEKHPTFYMYRNSSKPYHIDYVYLPQNKVDNSTIEVGAPDKWLQYSDHMPLFVETETETDTET